MAYRFQKLGFLFDRNDIDILYEQFVKIADTKKEVVEEIAAPVVVASLLISVLLFAFDHYYIPGANRRQEMLRAEIKKKPVATYRRPDRQWVYGQGSRIYYFLHLDPKSAMMSKANVFEIDPKTFHVVHQISADRAQWNDRLILGL